MQQGKLVKFQNKVKLHKFQILPEGTLYSLFFPSTVRMVRTASGERRRRM